MTEDNSKTESLASDRASFMVGLFGALLALYPFKDTAQKIQIVLFTWGFSLYNIAGILLVLLLMSAYFYGLNSIRYSLDKLVKLNWLKFIENIADLLYVVAFMFPVLIFLLWLMSLFFNFLISNFRQFQDLIIFVSNFSGVVTAILSFVVSTYIFKQKEKQQLEELDKIQKYYSRQFTKNSGGSDLRLKILGLFQALMATLESVLTKEIGLGVKRMPSRRIIQIAQERSLITQQEYNAILDLAGIRNQIAHNLDSFKTSDKQVKYLENIILQTIRRVEKMERLRHG